MLLISIQACKAKPMRKRLSVSIFKVHGNLDQDSLPATNQPPLAGLPSHPLGSRPVQASLQRTKWLEPWLLLLQIQRKTTHAHTIINTAGIPAARCWCLLRPWCLPRRGPCVLRVSALLAAAQLPPIAQ